MYSNRYTIETDTHCHTVASDHAYSTVLEMASFAHKKGLKAIAITDHGPQMPDGAHEWHFGNLSCLPDYIENVRVLHGAEANILDSEGHLDISEDLLHELDWIIASCHEPVLSPGSIERNTAAYLAVAQNPYVDVIGHSGGDNYKYDYERVIPVFGKYGKLVEINAHSSVARRGAKNCVEIAKLCMKYGVGVVVNSDAHICFSVGDLEGATKMLASIDFPNDLIINRTLDSLAGYILKKRNRNIIK